MTDEHPHYAKRAIDKIDYLGEFCLCVHSESEEAKKIGGRLFFTHLTGQRLPTKGCAYLIDNGLLKPNGDGLFEGCDQTFELVAEYEMPQ